VPSRKTKLEAELMQAKYQRALSTLDTFVGAAMLDMQRNSNPAIVAAALTNLMAKKYANDTDFVRVIASLAISQLALIRKTELEQRLPAPAQKQAPETSESSPEAPESADPTEPPDAQIELPGEDTKPASS
jgi:hypothetical protein